MTIYKLNARGVAHHFLLALIVVSIGIFGAYKIIASHADTLSYKNGLIASASGGTVIYGDGSNSNPYQAQQLNGHGYYINGLIGWSPDGSQIAYYGASANNSESGFYTANSDGSNPKKIYTFPGGTGGNPTWSPDGTKLVIPNVDGLDVIDISTGTLKTIPNSEPNGTPSYGLVAKWSTDGNRIAYVGGGQALNVCTIQTDGTNKICINLNIVGTDGFSPYINAFDWSRDNTTFLVSAFDGKVSSNIYSIKVDGSGLTKLTSDNISRGVAYSPDGTKIAYSSSRQGAPILAIMSIDGSNQVTYPAVGIDTTLSWQALPAAATVTPAPTQTASCSITLPTTLTYHQVIAPTVTLTNTGNQTLNFPLSLSSGQSQSNTNVPPTTNPQTVNVTNLAPGAKATFTFNSFTVPYGNLNDTFAAAAQSQDAHSEVSCYANVALPVLTAKLNGTTPVTVNYGQTVTISGATGVSSAVSIMFKSPVQSSYVQSRSLTSSSSGTFSTTYSATVDETFYSHVTNGKAIADSNKLVTLVRPTVTGATTRTVSKGQATTITGKYTPGQLVTIHLRKSSDKAGTYPSGYNLHADSSGNYTYKFSPTLNSAFYVTAANGTKTAVYTYSVK